MRTYARNKTKEFSRVLSHDVHQKTKAYKLKSYILNEYLKLKFSQKTSFLVFDK